MRLHVGTSGYSYREWRGSFYPEDLAPGEMLSYYAGRLSAVEINSTFYRLPRVDVLESWAEQVPDGFRFVLKASRRITHFKRLREAEEETGYLLRSAAEGLGEKAAAILFQLPPDFRRDLPRLEDFLAGLPAARRSAFEFRHESWFDPEVFECLERHGAALCAAETDGAGPPERLRTAAWGYLRLRRSDYPEEALAGWVERVREQGWEEAYVFFKHEAAGKGPALARRFLQLAGER